MLFQDTLTGGQRVFGKKAAVISQPSTLSRAFSIIGRSREVIEFDVTSQGTIEARAEWTGTADILAIILNGPGKVQAYARQDGKSPLTVSFVATPEIVSLGKSWKLSVVNFDSRTNAQGVVRISYPAAAAAGVEAPMTVRPERPSIKRSEEAIEKEFKKREITWSPVSQRESPADRKHKPPSLEVPIASLESPKPVQFKSNLIKVNKRAPIAFKPFDIVDPATAKQIDPETILTLPNDRKISANDYYEELNRLEEGFNKLGYTLDVRRDPALQVRLQEISLPRAEIEANAKRSKIIIESHKFPARPVPKTTEVLRRDFRTRLVEDRNRLIRLQKHLYPGHGSDPPAGQQARSFYHPVETPKFEFGYRDVFAVFLNGGLYLSGDLGKAEVKTEAEAGGYVFSNRVSILRLTGTTSAPSSGGTLKANLMAYILGIAYPIVDQKKTIPSVPLDQLPQVPSLDLTEEWSKSDDYSFAASFPLGPILVSVRTGIRFTAGVGCGLFLSPLSASGQVGPFVASDVFVQGGIDIIIAEAGVRCTLLLLDNTLTMEAEVGLDANERGPFVAARFLIYDELEMLSGEFALFFCIYVPAWDWPPWKKKCWDWVIADWDGIKEKGYIFPEEEMTFYIYEGGPPESQTTGKEEDTFDVTGVLGGGWLPEKGSIPDPELTNQYAPPALVAFGDRLYKIWSGIGSSGIYVSSCDGTVYIKQEKKTQKRYDRETGRYEEFPILVKTPYLNWSKPKIIPGRSYTSERIRACVYKNRLYVFHVGTFPDKSIYYRSMGPAGEWKPAAGSVRITGTSCAPHCGPAVALSQDALWLIFMDSASGLLVPYVASGTSGEDHLLDFHLHGRTHALDESQSRGNPAVGDIGIGLLLFHRGLRNENIYYRCLSKDRLPPKKDVSIQGRTSFMEPAVAIFYNRVYLFYARKDRPINFCSAEMPQQIMDPGPPLSWGKTREIKGSLTYEMPSVCPFKDKIFLFHMDTKSNNVFWRWFETH